MAVLTQLNTVDAVVHTALVQPAIVIADYIKVQI